MSKGDSVQKEKFVNFTGTRISEKSFPIIVALKHRHGDKYYVAKSIDGVKKVALEIVKLKKDFGVFSKISVEDNFESYFFKQNGLNLSYFEDVVEKMGDLANDQVKFGVSYKDYVDYMKESFEKKKMTQNINENAIKAIKKEDTDLALQVLADIFDPYNEDIFIESQIDVY